jgi:hypothetical protein
LKLPNGRFVAGGKGNELIIVDSELKFVKRIQIFGVLETAIVINNLLFCAITANDASHIDVYDS